MKAQVLIALIGCLFVATAHGAGDLTKTIKNLKEAYQDEANAHNRYALFAKKADQEGHHQVAKLFRAASRSELVHSEAHKAALEQLGSKADPLVPEKATIGTTRKNLESAVKGESYERDVMYPAFIKQAQKAKAEPAVRSFMFAKAGETAHAKLYTEALANLGKNAPQNYYVCSVCGNTVTTVPHKKCPVCGSPADKYVRID